MFDGQGLEMDIRKVIDLRDMIEWTLHICGWKMVGKAHMAWHLPSFT